MSRWLVATVVALLLCVGAAQAYEFELGRTSYGDVSHGVFGTTEFFKYAQDSDPGSVFNFALSPDPHLWDYGYTGDKTAYSSNHLFQSSQDQFKINISFNQASVAAWDRDNGIVTPVLGCAWAISSPEWNSPLRGAAVADFVWNADYTFSGTLVSDGGIHWAGSASTLDLTLWDLQDTFRFTGNAMDGSMVVYASTLSNPAVPEPMSVLLGIMGLGSIAGFRRKFGK